MSKDSSRIYHDIHDYEECNSVFALNSNLLQVDRGKPTIRHDCLFMDGLNLRRFQISHALFDDFKVDNGWTTFTFTSPWANDAVWNGTHSLPNVLGVLHSGRDHQVLLPAGWYSIEIDIANHLIESEGLLPHPVYTNTLIPEKAQLRLDDQTAATVTRNLSALFDRSRLLPNAVLAENGDIVLRREILDQLATVVETAHPAFPTYHFHERRLVRQAREIIESELTSNLTIESIAHMLGVTTRSLQRSFKSVLGMSPKQYCLVRKLDAARRTIRLHGHRTSIVDIAHEFGFVSASRFTEQFKRQFGQAPSTVTRLMPHPQSLSL